MRADLEGVFYAGSPEGQSAGPGDTLLRDLYRGALALCVPSYYEGFGLPLLEAMACGTPVVASNASSLPEVGADAALYASPHDVEAWVDALRRIASDTPLRERLRDAGLQRVSAFSWDESARRHAEVFHSL
jgi:glycosyltransferase involved in cell wall biosynthesis